MNNPVVLPATQARRLRTLQGHFLSAEDCAASTAPVNPLDAYRQKASFCPKKLKAFYDGPYGALRDRIWDFMATDPIFQQPISGQEFTRAQHREVTIHHLKKLMVQNTFLSVEEYEKNPYLGTILTDSMFAFDQGLAIKFGVHFHLYVKSIKNMGTQKHQPFIDRGYTMEDIGCFALTELGHGSNVRGVETIATYDKETQEFVINSPTRTSTKWWIGGAGKTSNMTVCFAQLLLNGKNYGVHAFIVPIRNKADHSQMPGVILGDCGNKVGLNGIDNGFLIFENVRVPRDYMLNRFADVSPAGEYSSSISDPDKRFGLSLATLSGGRVGLSSSAVMTMNQGITIGIRYSAVRKQFSATETSPEWALIDYQLQQYRLIPYLAGTIAYHFAAREMAIRFNEMLMKSTSADDPYMAECHALSTSLKALTTWYARDLLQEVRECCGGHGYSAYNRIGVLRDDHDINTTWEGDNNVLLQQTAKFLMTSLKRKFSGKDIINPMGTLDYISAEPVMGSRCAAASAEEMMTIPVLIKAFQYRCNLIMQKGGLRLQALMKEHKDQFAAWNECQVFFMNALGKAHGELFTLTNFQRTIEKSEAGLKPVLTKLCQLYALSRISADLGTFREDDYLSSEQGEWVRSHILSLCKVLKHDAVALVDVISPPDHILASPIGCSDGKVYEHYFNAVRTAPNCFERPSWWKLLHHANK